MNPNTDPAPACPSCGTPWTEHQGITATCAENIRLERIISRAMYAFYDDNDNAENMLRILSELAPLPTKQP